MGRASSRLKELIFTFPPISPPSLGENTGRAPDLVSYAGKPRGALTSLIKPKVFHSLRDEIIEQDPWAPLPPYVTLQVKKPRCHTILLGLDRWWRIIQVL